MKINKILMVLLIAIGLIVSLTSTVKASPLPPSSLPIENVFSIPVGANSYVDGNVAVITKDIKTQVGSIFSTEANKMDLTESFHAEMYVYLGDKRHKAADGMTFIMHTDKKRTEKFTGGLGSQLGAYARVGSGKPGLQEQIERSFAVEFDTYHNRTDMDVNISYNGNKGHIAYSFPELRSSYYLNNSGNVIGLIHQGLYYPSDNLSNGKWHLFSVDWNADKNELAYKFDDAPTVNVAINPTYVFGSTSVYWGFTGSTGDDSQESKVAFKQIPGLVNLSSNMKVTKNGKDITESGVSATDGDVKVQFDVKYKGGKQNLLSPIFNLDLDGLLSYTPGTLTVNGTVVSDDFFVDGKLNYSLPTDLTPTEDTFTISFDGKPQIVTDKDTKTIINYSLNAQNYIGNSLQTAFPIKKVKLITSADFENQSWLINEINRQFAPRKIDTDIYEPDLAKITSIDIAAGAIYPTEHIPATMNKLTNLAFLQLVNLNLTGSLPKELGNLANLTTLFISGNNFDGGIPSELGKLAQVEELTLTNNNLKGVVPLSLGLLPKLKKINIQDNPLSGQLPDFPMNMDQITLNNTQITYNSAAVPSFLTAVEGCNYANTFITGLRLSGNAKVSSKNIQLKPFNESDEGYFNLKAIQEDDVTQDLYGEHLYTIKNTIDGTVYYRGKKDINATIPYEIGRSYTVILDDAEQNPNNVTIVLGQERELKFAEIPESISLKIKIGAKKQPVNQDGKLAIFDDRENKNWKLSVTLSKLTDNQRKLQGEYSYTGRDGISHAIVNDQKFLLETGGSDSLNGIIPISNDWGNNYGLSYTAYSSNQIGNYRGSVTWTLEDAP
ncbi:L-type lectin-domain containing protein [Carnobacterium maltaromaticum]|uniref:L-type lectin-domain containing protein n=1 Tax=Carnobacterium maltaromaticum TaxID=2751 RepID=UPI00026C8D80|nr:L-type lectin-domain containing protein [Carnobacterium maltaromaticum]